MGLTGLCCRLYTSARKQNDSDDCSQEKKPDFPGHSPKYFLRLARRGEVEVTIIRLITCSFFSFFFFFLFQAFVFQVMSNLYTTVASLLLQTFYIYCCNG